MKQLLIFAEGVLRMLILISLLITCINAFASGDAFIKVVSAISLIAVVYASYKRLKEEKDSK